MAYNKPSIDKLLFQFPYKTIKLTYTMLWLLDFANKNIKIKCIPSYVYNTLMTGKYVFIN